jgi:dolichyl-diphosphooligosaccharide--protein glycosyltransferase
VVDHHIAEVLFSTLFCFTYIVALIYTQKNPLKFNDLGTLKIPLILTIISGFAFILGFLTMPTMVLFALIGPQYSPLSSFKP